MHEDAPLLRIILIKRYQSEPKYDWEDIAIAILQIARCCHPEVQNDIIQTQLDMLFASLSPERSPAYRFIIHMFYAYWPDRYTEGVRSAIASCQTEKIRGWEA
jgi:hypothetical protein